MLPSLTAFPSLRESHQNLSADLAGDGDDKQQDAHAENPRQPPHDHGSVECLGSSARGRRVVRSVFLEREREPILAGRRMKQRQLVGRWTSGDERQRERRRERPSRLLRPSEAVLNPETYSRTCCVLRRVGERWKSAKVGRLAVRFPEVLEQRRVTA